MRTSARWHIDHSRSSREELIARIEELERLLADQNKILEALAAMDELTKLANRRTVVSRLCQEVARADRYGIPVSVLLLDVDHFRSVNERHGHPVGDRVLADLAAAIAREIRVIDFAGRHGGEEFLVVFPVTTATQACAVAERIRDAAGRLAFPEGFALTLSGGVAQYTEGTVENLVAAAEAALTRAKERGGDRIEAGS